MAEASIRLKWLCRRFGNSFFLSLIFFVALFYFLLAITVKNIASAGDSTSVNGVLLKTKNDEAINPKVVTRTADGGFLVVGSAGLDAWAAKVNEKGETVWEYKTGYREKIRYPSIPEFRGVVPMSDGSIYLCGNMPRPLGSGLPSALLTHLDGQGHALEELLLAPLGNQQAAHDQSTFIGCTRWNDSVALLGTSLKVTRPAEKDVAPVTENYYWIAALHATGDLRWEKLIPFSFGGLSSIISRDTSLIGESARLIFSVSDTNNTDVISVDSTGDVRNRMKIQGYFKLIEPVKDDSILQLWGTRQNIKQTVLVSLDDALTEINEIQGYPEGDFFAGISYRLSDKSIISFGKGVHPFGQTYRAEGVYVDQNLNKKQRINLEQGQIDDAGQIWAATPTNHDNEFLVVKTALNKNFAQGLSESGGNLGGFRRGAVLQFVKFD